MKPEVRKLYMKIDRIVERRELRTARKFFKNKYLLAGHLAVIIIGLTLLLIN